MQTPVSRQSEVASDSLAQAQDNRLLNAGTVSRDVFKNSHASDRRFIG